MGSERHDADVVTSSYDADCCVVGGDGAGPIGRPQGSAHHFSVRTHLSASPAGTSQTSRSLGMICSASSFFPCGMECPPLVLTQTGYLSGSGAV